ncbi:MAG TPA: hypothetical protein DEQ26_09085 [Flavobacteriaceae bacterium]|nr:hypothetical protein [Flavobacteriaceae bacterium]
MFGSKEEKSRSEWLKLVKSYIVDHATEKELIELIELMRLRKKSLDLQRIANDKAKLTNQ